MTVKCASAKNAIGYRIQYSTDYKFKKVSKQCIQQAQPGQ